MSRIPLVVGMPVYRRAWILNDWFDSLESQEGLPKGTRLLFAVSPSDDGTEQIISRRAPNAEVIYVEGLPTFEEDEKDAANRYAVLASVRNTLLRRVCSLEPDFYLSWDSDILLRPTASLALRTVAQGRLSAGVVGALVDMGGDVVPGNWSWMTLSGTDAFRPETVEGLPVSTSTKRRPFRVDVTMGVKLMSPSAYMNGRYADHILGEDVGFAIGLRSLGIESFIAPFARGEHRYRLA